MYIWSIKKVNPQRGPYGSRSPMRVSATRRFFFGGSCTRADDSPGAPAAPSAAADTDDEDDDAIAAACAAPNTDTPASDPSTLAAGVSGGSARFFAFGGAGWTGVWLWFCAVWMCVDVWLCVGVWFCACACA